MRCSISSALKPVVVVIKDADHRNINGIPENVSRRPQNHQRTNPAGSAALAYNEQYTGRLSATLTIHTPEVIASYIKFR